MTQFTEQTFEAERETLQRARDEIRTVITRLVLEQRAVIAEGAGTSIQARHIARILADLSETDLALLEVKVRLHDLNSEE